MELTKKIKIALDETRMLILGAQILLGFQFRGFSTMATTSCQSIYAIWMELPYCR